MEKVQHIVSAAPFTPENLQSIFRRAQELRLEDDDIEKRREKAANFLGRRAVNVFYQESSRTRISFELAQEAWGIGYSTTTSARHFSSAAKGESLEHTIEVIEEYNPDLVVLRYDEEGGAREAASLLKRAHLINAGDGSGEHPTQAIQDSFTIQEQLGKQDLNNLNLTFMGDLRFGRTVRSLVHVLSKGKDNHFNFISHPDLGLSDDIVDLLQRSRTITFEQHDHASVLSKTLPDADILYVTRTQLNQGAPSVEGEEFRVTWPVADLLPEHASILHPMPIDRKKSFSEIAPEVDKHPRARYYRQAGNGLYIRMALIEKILKGIPVLEERETHQQAA